MSGPASSRGMRTSCRSKHSSGCLGVGTVSAQHWAACGKCTSCKSEHSSGFQRSDHHHFDVRDCLGKGQVQQLLSQTEGPLVPYSVAERQYILRPASLKRRAPAAEQSTAVDCETGSVGIFLWNSVRDVDMHTSCKAEYGAVLCKMLWLVRGMWAGSCRNRSIAQRHIEHGGMGKSEGNVLCVPSDPDQTEMLTLNSHPLQEVSRQSLRKGWQRQATLPRLDSECPPCRHPAPAPHCSCAEGACSQPSNTLALCCVQACMRRCSCICQKELPTQQMQV